MTGVDLIPASSSLDDGTLARTPGSEPGIVFEFDSAPLAFKKGRGFDFNPALFSSMVTLIQDRNSTLFNFGPLLIKKMLEIKNEGQMYFWEMRNTKNAEQLRLRAQLSRRKKSAFVRMGDFSCDVPVGRRGKRAGSFDKLFKVTGTTNCSTAILDALYRALGGEMTRDGKILKIGGVNGIPLTDGWFSGFPKQFQGREWDSAIEAYGLGYKVTQAELKKGDIISMPGHRMVFVKTMEMRKGLPFKIRTIEARPPTGNAIQYDVRKIKKHWRENFQAARIFDIGHA